MKTEVLSPNKQLRYHTPDMSMQTALRHWEGKTSFSRVFIRALASCPFEHFVLEFPPVSGQTVHGVPFEFVVTHEPRLHRPQSLDDFQQHSRRGKVVTHFPNLSGDSTLVVPLPGRRSGGTSDFSSVGPFSRTAPLKRQLKLWKRVARCLLKEMKHDPHGVHYWLSTSGLGVPWLHVRIDNRPKYYVYEPFKRV